MRRRAFMAGSLSVTFVVAGCSLPVIPKRPAPTPEAAQGWIQYRDGRYVLYLPRVEMGQNIATAMKHVACIELGVPATSVDMRLPSTQDIAQVRATVGSESVRHFVLPLAQACATLREAIASGQLSSSIGAVLPAEPLPAGQLRAFKRSAGSGSKAALPLEQAQQIVRGEPLYAADVRRPGMLFGRVLRAPASPELNAHALAMNEAAARAQPGFVALVRDPLLQQANSLGVGIVARTPGALDRIEAALALQWQVEGGFDQADVDRALDIDTRLARGALAHDLVADPMDRDARWDVDLRFDIPLAAHGQMEPRAAVAEFGGDGALQLWVGSQDVFYQRDVMARRFGLDAGQVTVHSCRVGGAFGGKTICTVELEAAVLARAAAAPVKVQWTRTQELRYGFGRSPSSHRVRVRLDQGRLGDWWHAFASSHILFMNAALPAWMQRFTDFVGDGGVARGATLAYTAARRRTEFDLVRLPVFSGPWRGLGAGPNGLVIESVIDECAFKAGIDPLQFRLANLEDARLKRVLHHAAHAAGWGSPVLPAAAGQRAGRGLACGIYKENAFAAVVADVTVDDDGHVQLQRLVCAHDCGHVINPDQVRAQCEGNLVWGIGMVLYDDLPVADSRVAAGNFDAAPIPRIQAIPRMQVLLIDEGEAPGGAGETAIVAAGAAISNAIRAATGVRLTRFPARDADLRRSSV
jgi:isoquinoline 1-oxidoreductase subunit beta